MTVKVSQLILETEIQNKYKLKKTMISETKQLSNQVGTVLSDIIYRGLLYKLRKAIDGKIRKWRMTHERKLQHLRAQLPVRNKQVLRKFVPNIIHNFSSYTLTKREKEVLSYSLDQCVPSKIDQQGLKVEFEHYYQNILPHLSHLSHEEQSPSWRRESHYSYSGERAFDDVEKHFRGRHGFDGRLLHLQCWLSTENEEDFPIYST